MNGQKGGNVLLKYFARIAEITGKREEWLPIQDKTSLADFLISLFALYDDELKDFVTSNGTIRPNIGILVNGSSIDKKSLGKIMLNDSDVVVILPPIAGG